MVKVKRGYVFGAFVSTVVAVALSLASISTDYWVDADLKAVKSVAPPSHVRYGLFGGVFTRGNSLGDKTVFEITMTCVYDENACAVICRDTQEEREQELRDIVQGKNVSFNCNFEIRKRYNVADFSLNQFAKANVEGIFINAGCYLSTVIFLSLSIAMGVLTACLLMWNVIGNPVQTLFSIYSIYYYVAIAACLVLLPIIIWGAMFATSIVHNVSITMTLNGVLENSGNPILHFSYWLNIGSLVCYMTSFGLLIARKYMMDNENMIMTAISQGNPVIF